MAGQISSVVFVQLVRYTETSSYHLDLESSGGHPSRPESRTPLDQQSSPRAGTAEVIQTGHVSCDDLMRIAMEWDRGVHRQNKPTTRPVSGSSPTSQNPVKPLLSYHALLIKYRTDLAGFQGQAWSACLPAEGTRSQPLPKVSQTESE